METLGNEGNSNNNEKKFYCKLCDVVCRDKFNFARHLMTAKHINPSIGTPLETKNEGLEGFKEGFNGIKSTFSCEICYKKFLSKSGLWKHKTKASCTKITPCFENNDVKQEGDSVTDKDLIIMLIKQNTDLMGQNTELMTMLKNNTSQICHNTNSLNNNNNKTFNLQFFLNETCKDAMNITDFIESIKLQLSDLEKVGEVGYIEGLSNIITTNLKVLDVTERPVHCTDKKRETIYIKDQDKWEKEDDNKTKLRKAIKKIADKNFRLLPQYREKYKGCQYSESKHSDKYNKLMIEALGGDGDNDIEKEDKIIRNISKNILVEKAMQLV
jgi:Zinc-finger of C2H2 type